MNAEATVTTANITGLIAGATYSITMVATYSTLPNTETEAHTVTIGTIYQYASWVIRPPTIKWLIAFVLSLPPRPPTINFTHSI